MWILDRQEAMEIFDLYALMTSRGASLVNAMHAEEDEVETTNPALSWISRVLPDEVKSVHGPRPVRNHFLKGILSGDAQTAFQVNVTPDYRSLSPAEISTKYTLPNFNRALADFITRSSMSGGENTHWDPKYGRYQAWNKFRLQLYSAFQQCVIMPSRQAIVLKLSIMLTGEQHEAFVSSSLRASVSAVMLNAFTRCITLQTARFGDIRPIQDEIFIPVASRSMHLDCGSGTSGQDLAVEIHRVRILQSKYH